MESKIENLNGFKVSEEDLVILESLIRSPAFATLKRVLDHYRKECHSILLTSLETHKMYQTQGRIIGINVIEQLPVLLVAQKKHQDKKATEEKEKFKHTKHVSPNPKKP